MRIVLLAPTTTIFKDYSPLDRAWSWPRKSPKGPVVARYKASSNAWPKTT